MTDPETRVIPVDVVEAQRIIDWFVLGGHVDPEDAAKLTTALETLAAENARLREALEPFAGAAGYFDERYSDDGQRMPEGYSGNMVAGVGGIEVRHYREARAALSPVTQVKEPRP